MEQNYREEKIPRIQGTLRAHTIELPKAVWKAPGMIVLGRRIKSLLFSTDVAIIRNCNADAVLAVYPFTPQQVISDAIIKASSIPVFVGVGGGTTKGIRSANIAQDAEAQGAYGVVVNSPMSNTNIKLIKRVIDIPIIVTVMDEDEVQDRLEAGATILNVANGKNTAETVRRIRKRFPDVPIIASGGQTDQTILKTIEAGADAISYTPPSTAEIFSNMMAEYRNEKTKNPDITFETLDSKKDEIKLLLELLSYSLKSF